MVDIAKVGLHCRQPFVASDDKTIGRLVSL